MNSTVRLQRAPNGRLLLYREGQSIPVRPRRCFPWASPNQWISLRDDEGREQALIHRPETLESASREVLLQELRDCAQPFEITRIHECRKEIELRCWRVDTAQGPRAFQTELDEWPQRLPHGGVLIRDLAGDLYTVNDPDQLDAESRVRLWALLD